MNKLKTKNKINKIDESSDVGEIEKIYKMYKSDLSNYKYMKHDDIPTIEIKSHICYVKKSDLTKKHAIIKSIKNPNVMDSIILELVNNNKSRHWFIYAKDVYVFLKDRPKNGFRDLLQDLFESDFSNLTMITSKNITINN